MSNTAFTSHDDPPASRQTSSWIPWLVIGLLVVLVVYYVIKSSSGRAYGTRHPAVGKAPARFRLEPLTGAPPPLDRQALQGKVTLVNFWGTWCPPCQVEFPHIVDLWEEHQEDADFQLAAVSCNPQPEEDIDELRQRTADYLAAAGTSMPNYYDPQGLSRLAVADVTGEAFVYPTTILLDRQGSIRGVWRGYRPGTEDEIAAATEAALAEK